MGVEGLLSAKLRWGKDATFPSALSMDLYGFSCFGIYFILKILIATVIEDQVNSLPSLSSNAAVRTDAG